MLRVLVIAKDEPNSAPMMDDITVVVNVSRAVLPKPSSPARLLRLTAPALNSRIDVNWAGQSWGNRYWNSTTGRPMGVRTTEAVVAQTPGTYFFTLPQLSAAMLVVEDCSGA